MEVLFWLLLFSQRNCKQGKQLEHKERLAGVGNLERESKYEMGERRKALQICGGSIACRIHVMVEDYEFKVKSVKVSCIMGLESI